MKIKKDILLPFLTELHMNDVVTCLLQFNEQGLVVNTASQSATHNAYGIIPKSSFEEYEPVGNVGIDYMPTFIKIVKRLGEVVDFKVEGNLLSADGKKMKVQMPLIDEKFIEAVRPMPDIEFDTSFKLDLATVKKFLNDAGTNKNFQVVFETVDDGVTFYNTGTYKFTYREDSEGTTGGVVAKFGIPFYNVMRGMDSGIVTVDAKTDYPLKIKRETEHYTIDFIIAPVVNQD